MIQLSHPTSQIVENITISGSKSESNRWLILQKIFPEILEINNLSSSEDTNLLKDALKSAITNQQSTINIGHAGTAMRFLTAYLGTTQDTDVILTGSKRMQQRPIAPLVNALRDLGCAIEYVENEGFPPLAIKGKTIQKDKVDIQANVSSQYITALMLIAPRLKNGLKIQFTTDLTSKPYVEMTKSQLESIGIDVEWLDNGIQVFPKKEVSVQRVTVESDWSSASYWYSIAALSNKADVELKYFKKNSLQGDADLVEIYETYFGVKTEFENETLKISKIPDFKIPDYVELNLNKTPDIAQTIAVTCSGLKMKAQLTGLHTLKVKETDRLVALQNEMTKVGAKVEITNDSLKINSFLKPEQIPVIETYQDHRMAMSFAPLALKFPIKIQDEEVVIKSYPDFWKDLEKVGFSFY